MRTPASIFPGLIGTGKRAEVSTQKSIVFSMQQPPVHKPKPDIWINEAVAYMALHLDQPLSVASIAGRVNISSSQFFAVFKQRTGLAPKEYYTRLRMQRACQMLDNTMASVKLIAAELGYRDPLYFSRAFKSVNHVSPSDYRAARRRMTVKTIENIGRIQSMPANTTLVEA